MSENLEKSRKYGEKKNFFEKALLKNCFFAVNAV